jgi:glycosyltransferase involved in cell wall biosynthesis
MLYPNIIFETCCITALEAEAAGCPIVASANSALPETVGKAGMLISGEPGSEKYMNDFVAAVSSLLGDEQLWRACSEAGKGQVEQVYNWERVAERFEAEL